MRAFLGRNKAEELACSTITVGELAAGKNEIAARVFLRRLKKIPVSEAIAYRAAAVDRTQMAKGRRLGENDTWIAATAVHYSAASVQGDGDFERVGSLKRLHLGSQ
ncbi:MAG TPA: type II toxin-antitoxin system VapC family toxin [Opitutaceae bacterium]